MAITTLFLDIGGVLLTNGWDTSARAEAAKLFHLNEKAMGERHAQLFDLYEMGLISLDQYLDFVIFYEPRSFSKEQFKEFMFSCSKPHQEMIQLMVDIKKSRGVKMVAVSNEGRELMDWRILRFKLDTFIDFFVCSSFVGKKKPDPTFYRMALDMCQTDPKNIVYIDDRPVLVEVGRTFGMQCICHQNVSATRDALRQLGLALLHKKI